MAFCDTMELEHIHKICSAVLASFGQRSFWL
jgi:hypothetical protein